MRPYPDFLVRLDLAPDADERQVRRAYARELKKVDQERDLDGFQHLRACYEAALHWIQERGNDAAEPGREERVRAGTDIEAVHESPEALGAAVFAEFKARCAALRTSADDDAAGDAASAVPWVTAVQEALADTRLLNLDARVYFELYVASLLADGWQPGQHLLLFAAAAVFGWSDDSRGLRRLGYPGALLDTALEQHEMYLAQLPEQRAAQQEVLALLRKHRGAEAPERDSIVEHIHPFSRLQGDFPVLLHVLAPQPAVAAWGTVRIGMPFEVNEQARDMFAPEMRKQRRSFAIKCGIWLLILVALMSLPFFASKETGFASKETGGSTPISSERMEEIRKRIDYQPAEDTLPGTQIADVQVFVDADGNVTSIEPIQTGASPEFVDAIVKAIRSSGPFPPGTAPSSKLEYTVTVDRKTAGKYIPSAAPQAPPTGRGEPVTKERLMLMRRHVEYRPGDDVAPGEYTVRVEVRLDARHQVAAIRPIGPLADPALFEAVAKAIRTTGPFPQGTTRVFDLEYKVTIQPKRTKAPAPRESGAASSPTNAESQPAAAPSSE